LVRATKDGSWWRRFVRRLSTISFRQGNDSETDNNKILQPFTADPLILVKNHVLSIMVDNASRSTLADQEQVKTRTRLLNHAVCRQLTRLKWKQFGIWIFLADFLCYILFLGLFTWAAMRNIEPAKFYDAVNVSYANIYSTDDSNTCQEVSEKLNARTASQIEGLDHRKDTTDQVLKYILYVLLWLQVIKGCLFIVGVYRLKIKGRFYAEVIALVLCFVYLVDNWNWQRDTRLRCFYQWQTGAFGLFMAWATLLAYVRYFPFIGLYVVMLEVIVTKFLWFAPVLIILICSFAFPFFMLLQNEPVFGNIGFSWMRSG
jgi:hypothetical protein